MKWLKQAVDQGDGMGFNGLHDEPVCCMDQTVSEPVRLRYPTFESIPVSVSKDLLKHVLNALQQTNMQRENLLAFFKAAGRGRISKRLPTMERYSFSAELATLLKQHRDRGHGNPLLETRDELLDAGIPVKAAHSGRQKRGKANLPKRADVRWRNAAFAAWKKRNPNGGSAEFMAESRTWNDMSDAEKHIALLEQFGHAALPREEREDDANTANTEPGRQWSGNDGRWPVAPEIVEVVQGSDSRQ